MPSLSPAAAVNWRLHDFYTNFYLQDLVDVAGINNKQLIANSKLDRGGSLHSRGQRVVCPLQVHPPCVASGTNFVANVTFDTRLDVLSFYMLHYNLLNKCLILAIGAVIFLSCFYHFHSYHRVEVLSCHC